MSDGGPAWSADCQGSVNQGTAATLIAFTPGQFSRRADFYHQLAQLTAAGLGILPALQQLAKHPPARNYRAPIQQLIGCLNQGYTVAESLQHLGRWLPEFDLALIQAGEQSGRLDVCFRLLADYYTNRASLARQLIADLAYPVFLFHFAVFILAFPSFFQSGNLNQYLLQTFAVLLPIYLVVFLCVFALQGRRGETWRGILEDILRPWPVLGRARQELALSRLAAALEALITAGVTIVEAWQLAAAASGSPALRRTVNSWKSPLAQGSLPSELVAASPLFPDMFRGQYSAAEISGSLDEALRRLARYYLEEGTRRTRALAQWTPRIVFLLVAVMIAFKVISFYAGYFKMIQDIGNF